MGPLTSPMHRDRVLSYVKVAIDEGGEVLTGGTAPDDPALAKGCYIEPTVVRAAARTTGSAARRCSARSSRCRRSPPTTRRSRSPTTSTTGSAAGCGRSDLRAGPPRRRRAARRDGVDQLATSGSTRARRSAASGLSGYGREMGFEAMHEYTEAKSVWVNVDAELPAWYPR